jgi:hypothetical protein
MFQVSAEAIRRQQTSTSASAPGIGQQRIERWTTIPPPDTPIYVFDSRQLRAST